MKIAQTGASPDASIHNRDNWLEGVFRRIGLGYKADKGQQREAERAGHHLEHCKECRNAQAEGGVRSSFESALDRTSSHAPSRRSLETDGIRKTIVSIEGKTCASCTTSITSTLESHPSVLSAEISLLSSSGVIRHRTILPSSEVVEIIEDAGFDAQIICGSDVSPIPIVKTEQFVQDLVRSTFMIEGMTCASCSSAVDRALRRHPEIKEVSIDVLSHKGVIVHDRNISPSAIKDIIEHGGYGADLSSAEARPETAKDKQNANGIDTPRSVDIRIQGVYCGNCITQINNHLSSQPLNDYTPVTLANPLTTLSYIPLNQ